MVLKRWTYVYKQITYQFHVTQNHFVNTNITCVVDKHWPADNNLITDKTKCEIGYSIY